MQVPQYLFEDAVATGQGGATNIIICQPRRIAAVGLATRVADEVRATCGWLGAATLCRLLCWHEEEFRKQWSRVQHACSGRQHYVT
jgi:hypothetical protein